MYTANPDEPLIPKLKSLSFRNINLFSKLHLRLVGILLERRNRNLGLESLVIQGCRVPTAECRENLEDLVEKVTWDDAIEIGSGYGDSETETEEVSDETEESDEATDSDEYHNFVAWGRRHGYI